MRTTTKTGTDKVSAADRATAKQLCQEYLVSDVVERITTDVNGRPSVGQRVDCGMSLAVGALWDHLNRQDGSALVLTGTAAECAREFLRRAALRAKGK